MPENLENLWFFLKFLVKTASILFFYARQRVNIIIEILQLLARIQDMTFSTFLRNDQITEMERRVDHFKDAYLQNSLPLTPKFHWIIAHVIPFAHAHHFYGLASEQGLGLDLLV